MSSMDATSSPKDAMQAIAIFITSFMLVPVTLPGIPFR